MAALQEAELLGPAAALAAHAAPRHPCAFKLFYCRNPPRQASRAVCTRYRSIMSGRDVSNRSVLNGGSCSNGDGLGGLGRTCCSIALPIHYRKRSRKRDFAKHCSASCRRGGHFGTGPQGAGTMSWCRTGAISINSICHEERFGHPELWAARVACRSLEPNRNGFLG